MREIKISELPIKEFDGGIIDDNMFYVDDPYAPINVIKAESIFKWIKDKAEKEGLTIKIDGEQIMFISGITTPSNEEIYKAASEATNKIKYPLNHTKSKLRINFKAGADFVINKLK